MTAATSRTPKSPWRSPASARTRSKPSTTPNGFPPGRTPASVGQPLPPRLSPPMTNGDGRAPSPSYFGLVVDPAEGSPVDSDAGVYAKGNWHSPSSSVGSKAAASPQVVPPEQNPEMAEFRRQSEAYAFHLGNLHRLHSHSANRPAASSPLAQTVQRSQSEGYFPTLATQAAQANADAAAANGNSVPAAEDMLSPTAHPQEAQTSRSLDPVRSPGQEQRLTSTDERQHRLSLTQERVQQSSAADRLGQENRSHSMPTSNSDAPGMMTPETFAELYQNAHPNNLLLLDLRVAPQYSKSRIRGALNLCIPTTLLKRPSFNVARLADAFNQQEDQARFARWKEMTYIIVYDANSSTIRDATSSVNTLKKFASEGWTGTPYIIRGGFQAISKIHPHLVEKSSGNKTGGLNKKGLRLQPEGGAVDVAGGCYIPAEKSGANPFFGNIRQNMDLIGGVGQIEIQIPDSIAPRSFGYLPNWLQRAADIEDKGKAVSEAFLALEKSEQRRMQAALSGDVEYGTPAPRSSEAVSVSGIEKGAKNRYKDILPFDHSRVKLQNVEASDCDYINASHVKVEWSNRRYIAAQAPVPATFEDFWRVVWEQEVRVIVMLTAEMEGGQQKAHPYWVPGSYGPMKVKALSEKRIALVERPSVASKVKRAQLGSPLETPIANRRRGVTNPLGLSTSVQEASTPTPGESEIPQVLVRKLALSRADEAFAPMREITQLHFSQWPDFGTISARDVLGLVEQCNAVARVSDHAASSAMGGNPLLPAPKGARPILVHCSAGCGRTGTFCTIDSAVDMLKRQRMAQHSRAMGDRTSTSTSSDDEDSDPMDVDGDTQSNGFTKEGVSNDEPWVHRDDTDLVAKAVSDFRLQRLSMVQTLRQYVLCYEAVLEWCVKQNPDKFGRENLRRSFQG